MRRRKWEERQERNREDRQMESELGRKMERERVGEEMDNRISGEKKPQLGEKVR